MWKFEILKFSSWILYCILIIFEEHFKAISGSEEHQKLFPADWDKKFPFYVILIFEIRFRPKECDSKCFVQFL